MADVAHTCGNIMLGRDTCGQPAEWSCPTCGEWFCTSCIDHHQNSIHTKAPVPPKMFEVDLYICTHCTIMFASQEREENVVCPCGKGEADRLYAAVAANGRDIRFYVKGA